MIMKKIFIAFTLLLYSVVASAQVELPGRVKVFCPQVLLQTILTDAEANALMKSGDFGQSQRNTEKYWYAYGDRADNTTYSAPSSSSAKFSALEFNEEVRIAEIRNGFALVYTEPMKSIEYPRISSTAKVRGWVPMKHLLLWSACPTNDKGIYNKALLCVNIETAKSGKGENIGIGYRVPDKEKGQTYNLTTDLNFYFIMKYENGMALLSQQSKMDGQYSSQVLYYWVPENSFVPWNQRSCLEPTWEQEDVEYFADKGITSDIFANRALTGPRISHISFSRKESERYDQYLYRMNGDDLRFPILDEGSNSAYNMSTFSSMGGKAAGTDVGGESEASKAAAIQQNKLQKMRNINLAIVIDGTSSMEPYYPAVRDAIKDGCQAFSKDAKIKIGVVIYRDYEDGEEGLVEVLPLRSAKNLSVINSFLDEGGRYGIKSSKNDRTYTEAMFNGLNTALDKLDFTREESNIMLVIGDCGNDPEDTRSPGQDEILKKLVEKNVSLMGFQVKNSNIVAYNLFTNQITSLMRKSLQENYRLYNPEITINTERLKDGYNYLGKGVEPQIYLNSYRFADPAVNNGTMDPSKLGQHLVESITSFSGSIQKQMDLIVNASSASKAGFLDSDKSQSGNIQISKDFIRMTLGEEWEEAMKNSNALINFRGFTEKQKDGRNFYKPVIFISGEEFDDLLKRMAPVEQASNISNASDRTPYIEAMKALVKSFAPGMTDAEMASLNNAQITAMIGGLNEASAGLVKYKLDDLSNSTIISNPQYLSIIRDFARKYKNLRNIRSSKKYKYVKEFNGSRYYWIPIEDLP